MSAPWGGPLPGRLLEDALQTTDGVTLVRWGWDCIDCQGDFGMNDSCDSCGGTNRIPLYATAAGAAQFDSVGTL